MILVYNKTVGENRKALHKLHTRLRYIETAANYRNITPLPWERDDYYEVNNVIYIKDDN